MKKIYTLKYLLGALLLGGAITACDKFEEDVPPARMENLKLHDDYYSTLKNHSVQLNVLANDTIGSTASVQFGQPQHGTVSTSNGNVLYQPDSTFTGTDSFQYQACLGNDCASALVTVEVKNDTTGNTCTVKAFDDFRSLSQFDTISVLKNDNLCGITPAGTTIAISQPPLHGQAFINPLKQIEYHANSNFVGHDELTYTITNAKGQSSAKVRFSVTAPPCRIRAVTDSAYINRVLGTIDTVSAKVLTNDIFCPNQGPATITLNWGTQTQYGTFSLVGTGANARIIYTTSAGKNFTDYVLYNVCQGSSCSTAYLYVHVR